MERGGRRGGAGKDEEYGEGREEEEKEGEEGEEQEDVTSQVKTSNGIFCVLSWLVMVDNELIVSDNIKLSLLNVLIQPKFLSIKV